jgi:nucleolar protein 56
MKHIFNSILGDFIYDDKSLKKVEGKSPKLELLPEDKISEVLSLLHDKKYFKEFYKKNLTLTKKSIKEAVSEDQLIIQAIANVNELDKLNNVLTKRLREWYSLYLPEFSEEMPNHEKFVELSIKKSKASLMEEFHLKETMGADLAKVHVDEMILLAKQIQELTGLRKNHEIYLEKIMKKYCLNLMTLAGVTIGAKLIELSRSLKRLALLPSSTVQLLGAEKALFRHIKTGSRSPKYGVIINHPLIQNAKRDKKGKAARMLADKLSLCARLDFFKGEFKAEEYRKELEKKLE